MAQTCKTDYALQKYPLEKWRGGSIRRIRPSVILLERGQIFSLGGKRFFTMGGASSHDIQDGILEPDDPLFKKKCRQLDARGAMYRINHLSWWKEELPSEDEYQTARANLDRAGWEVDYIITHCCPSSVQDIFSGGLYQRDTLTEFFDEVRQARLSGVRSGEAPPSAPASPSFHPLVQPLTPGRRYRPKGGIPGRPRKLKGLRALYFKYLYLLGAVPKRRPKKRAAFVSRAEIIKFDRYQEQFQYLMKNRIETADQLSMQYDALQASIDALTDQRRELYRIRRAGHAGGAVTDEITGLTTKLRELRRELKLCARIEKGISAVQETVRADTSEARSVIHEKTDKSGPQRHFETGRRTPADHGRER